MSNSRILSQFRDELSDPVRLVDSDLLSPEARVALINSGCASAVADVLARVDLDDEASCVVALGEIPRIIAESADAPVLNGVRRLFFDAKLEERIVGYVGQDLESIRGDFRRVLEGQWALGFEHFYELVHSLSKSDLFQIVVDTCDTVLGEQEILIPLELECLFFEESLLFAQAQSDFEDWVAYVEGRKEEERVEEKPWINLNGAALPDLFPGVQEYSGRLAKYAKEDPRFKGASWRALSGAFQAMTERLFGDEYQGYYTPGTLNVFNSLVLRFWEHYPEADLIATNYEYLPMWYAVKGGRYFVDMPNLDFSEEDLFECFREKVESVLVSRNVDGATTSEAASGDKPIVLLVSSQMRIGAKTLDMEQLARLVDAYNEEKGFKLVHLWVDASQDSRVLSCGDIVFYSKRFAGTGGGMALAKKATYPVDDGKDIREGLRTNSGYNEMYIARLIASMFATENKFGHQYKDLVRVPGLWRYQGKGTFLAGELTKASQYLAESQVLRDLFDLDFALDSFDSDQWKVSAVMRLCPSEEGLGILDMLELDRVLRARGLCMTSFSLDGVEAKYFSIRINDLWDQSERVISGSVDYVEWINRVLEYQDFYKAHIVRTLLPDGAASLPKEQVVKYFKASVIEHEYFRLFLTAVDAPDTLLRFVKVLEEEVAKMLDRS